MRHIFTVFSTLLWSCLLWAADNPVPDTAGFASRLQTGLSFMRQAQYDSADAYVSDLIIQIDQGHAFEISDALEVPYAKLQNHLGDIYWRSGQYPQALEHLRSLWAWEFDRFGRQHLQTSWTDFLIGSVLWSQEAYDSSLVYLHRSLDVRRALLPPDANEIIACYNSLGYVYGQISQYDRALNYHQQALTYRISTLGPQHNAVAQSYNNMGLIYERMGHIPEALRCHQSALRIRQALFPATHPLMATSYNNLGNVYTQSGDLALAAELLTKAHRIYRARLGTSHPWVGGSLINIGLIYQRQTDYPKALQTYREAIRLLTLAGGPIQPSIAGTMTNIGDVYDQLGQADSALYWQQQALDIWQQTIGPAHPQASMTQTQIARLYKQEGQYARALRQLGEVLKQQEATFGAFHPDLARTSLLLSEIYSLQNNCQEAHRAALQAEKYLLPSTSGYFTEEQLSLSDLMLMQTLYRQAQVREECGGDGLRPVDSLYSLALGVALRLREGFKREASQLALQAEAQPIIWSALHHAYQQYQTTGNPAYLDRGYGISQQGKANLMYRALQEAEARSQTDFPADQKQRLDSLEKQLALIESAVFRWGEAGQADSLQNAQDQLFKLRQQRDALLAQLEQAVPAYGQIRGRIPRVSLQAVQQILKEDEAVVEFVAGESEQLVWVIRADSVRLIPLRVSAGNLSLAVEALRSALAAGPGTGFEAPARSLYQMLWAPLQQMLPQRVTVIPDGILGYLPFDLLLYEAGDADSYLSRRHQIGYAYAPGFLPGVNVSGSKAGNGKLLAMAPAFGIDTLVGTQDTSWLAQRTALGPLRYNQREAQSIHQLWEGRLETGASASKALFLEQASRYRIIHIASHAAVNDQQPGFSFVAFSPEADSAAYRLYLNEIFGLNLAAELVVLSACETGIGTFYQGEGMASLARGFSMAGARAVLTTLWQVDDAGSLRFMERFYHHLKEQPDAAAALYQTRLDFIQAGEHPYIWAAYLPSGDLAGIKPRSGNSGLWPGLLVAILAGLLALIIWRLQARRQPA